MRRLLKLLLLLLGVLLSAAASHAADVGFSPTNRSVSLGNTFSMQVAGSSFAQTTEGGGVNISFNPAVLQVTGISVDTTTWEFFTQPGSIDNAQGRVFDLAFASFLGRSGNFPIATITFLAIAPGTSSLQLTESMLSEFASGGQHLSVSFGSGSVTVTEVPVPVVLGPGPGTPGPFRYSGSDTLATFTQRLVSNCGLLPAYPALSGARPAFNYLGGGSQVGGSSLRAGLQDIAPMSRRLNAAECATTSVPAGPAGELGAGATNPQNLPIGRDGITLFTSEANARRCDDDPNTDADAIEGTDSDFGATLAFSGSIAVGSNQYPFQGWRDVLRILFTGGNLTDTIPAGSFPPPSSFTEATRVARCGSTIRRALVAQWDNLIQDVAAVNTCGNVPGSCQDASGNALPLRHAFRRDDLSGTAATFLALLGLPTISAANVPFCNGTQAQDADPIRVTCSANSPTPAAPIVDGKEGGPSDNASKLGDEICGWDRTAGLVQALRVPALLGTTNTAINPGNRAVPRASDLYPTFNCGTGNFAIRRPPTSFATTFTCPDGSLFLFTGCLTPIAPAGSLIDHGDGTAPIEADCNCVNAWTNRAPGTLDLNPSIPGLTNDGRGWNNFIRGRHAGGGPNFHPTWSTPANICPVLRDESGTELGFSVFRMRERVTTINGLSVGSRVCRELSSTRQIGCLAKSSECALGFAGREAIIDQPNDDALPTPVVKDLGTVYNGATALRVGPAASDPAPPVRGPGPGAGEPKGYGPEKNAIFGSVANVSGYQLAIKLYIDSIVGFPAVLTTNVGPFVATGARLPSTGLFEQDQVVRCIFDTTNIPGSVPPTPPLALSLQQAGLLQLSSSAAIPTAIETCP